MKRTFPHGEDPGGIAGGDTDTLQKPKARSVRFAAGPPSGNSPAAPPGENKFASLAGGFHGGFMGGAYDPDTGAGGDSSDFNQPGTTDELENQAVNVGLPEENEDKTYTHPVDFLAEVRDAESQANLYVANVNRRPWIDALRAFHQQHASNSKYRRDEFKNRSTFFRAKTRSAARKDYAAVAASLFNNVDAINCLPGNEADPVQKASASLMQELVNYRTDRTAQKAALPWFLVSMGARLESYLLGVCVSKQYWKVTYKLSHTETIDGQEHDVYIVDINRPDIQLIPTENCIIDPAADWTNPAQSAQYFIIKWPMRIDEIHMNQNAPVNPWNEVPDDLLNSASDIGATDTSSIRRAREEGADRLSEVESGSGPFKLVWVYETFMRVGGRDWTFKSLGDAAFLTDPKPVEEVYPEQHGERPLSMGYGSLEPHRIYPMSTATSLQQYQGELNEIANLSLDALKQNIIPVTKIKRGAGVDLDQVKKRGYGTHIMMNDKDDVTWDKPPDIPQSLPVITRNLELEMDDLAGQFNGQTAQDNNALSRTLGGLKLVAGAANAVQEFDIRLWLTTWCEPTLSQLVRLEQYYEDDEVILGICGQKAELVQKHGINTITDKLLEQEVTIRVSAGLGAADPQQRLAKFGMATQICAPIIAQSPEFLKGELQVNIIAIIEEVYGAAGYKDAGDRFFKKGEGPPPDPLGDLPAQKIKSDIEKNDRTGRAALMTGLSAMAKAAIGKRELEDEIADRIVERLLGATDMGHQHAAMQRDHHLRAMDMGHQHGRAMVEGKRQGEMDQHQIGMDKHQQEMDRAGLAAEAAGEEGGGGAAPPAPELPEGGMEAAAAPEGAPEGMPPPAAAPPPPAEQLPPEPPPRVIRYHFVRDPTTQKITDAVPIYADQQQGPPA